MKKISVKKEMLVILIAVIMLFAIGTTVKATGNPIQIPVTNAQTQTPAPTQTPTTPNTNTTTNTTIAPTTNTVSNYQNTALPQTGDASDYAIFLVIVLVAAIAVYAYKKVRDYNI